MSLREGICKTEGQKPRGNASLAECKEYDATHVSVQEEAWRLVINILVDIFQGVALQRAAIARRLVTCWMTQHCKVQLSCTLLSRDINSSAHHYVTYVQWVSFLGKGISGRHQVA
jgi:hypothetical protein